MSITAVNGLRSSGRRGTRALAGLAMVSAAFAVSGCSGSGAKPSNSNGASVSGASSIAVSPTAATVETGGSTDQNPSTRSAALATSSVPAGTVPAGTAPAGTAPASTVPATTAAPASTVQPSTVPTAKTGGASTTVHAPTSRGTPGPSIGSAPPRTTIAPIPVSRTASFGGNVSAHISRVQAITAKAQGPGEITGPAVALTIVLRNGTRKPIGLDSTNVTLTYAAARTPGIQMLGPPSAPFHGAVAPGKDADAVYVFTVPKADRARVDIQLSYSPDAPVVQFSGAAV